MGWLKDKTSEVLDSFTGKAEGFATLQDVYSAIKNTPTPEFYELELAEVIEVWVDEEDLPPIETGENVGERDWSKYGWIKARLFYSSASESDYCIMKPMDTNIKDYPYPGEAVIAAQYVLGGDKNYYYGQKINFYNSVTTNSYPGFSKLLTHFTKDTVPENYKENLPPLANPVIRQLNVEEGDIAFNGRFGQSIRFGSNIKNVIKDDKTVDVNTGKEKSPNIIIRAGQGEVSTIKHKPVKEDINLDGASMWMTTGQLVPLTHEKSKVTDLDPKFRTDSSGKQIILNSDRIVFNSRKNAFLYSDNDINLVSKNRIVLEGHRNVYLGDAPKQGEDTGWIAPKKGPSSKNPNIQPVLKGDQTMDLIENLMNALIEFSTTMQSAKGSVVDFVVPVSGIKEGCMGLEGALTELKTQLNDPKSDIVKTG
jgi:hypothetical protein